MNQPQQPQQPDAIITAPVASQQAYPARPQPRPYRPPTAWESIPAFIRFAVWVLAILTVIWVVVLPVLGFMLLAGGLALGGAA